MPSIWFPSLHYLLHSPGLLDKGLTFRAHFPLSLRWAQFSNFDLMLRLLPSHFKGVRCRVSEPPKDWASFPYLQSALPFLHPLRL